MESPLTHEYALDLTQLELYEAGGILLALLAYPEDGGGADDERGALHRSLCALALKRRCVQDPAWAMEPQRIRPDYACLDSGVITHDCRTFLRRLRDRMIAGSMFLSFLREALGQAPASASPGHRHVSLNNLSEAIADEGFGPTDPEGVEKTVWRPSRPVVHLAAALGIAAQNAPRESLGPSLPEALLTNRWLIESVVELAEGLVALIPRAPRLPLDPGQLIRVRLA